MLKGKWKLRYFTCQNVITLFVQIKYTANASIALKLLPLHSYIEVIKSIYWYGGNTIWRTHFMQTKYISIFYNEELGLIMASCFNKIITSYSFKYIFKYLLYRIWIGKLSRTGSSAK